MEIKSSLADNLFKVNYCLNIYDNQLIGLVSRVFANGLGDLIHLCLTLSNIRYISRVKWSNPGNGVAPSPTPRCSCY